MDLATVKEWIAAGNLAAVESAWLEALSEKAPAGDLAAVVEALAAAGHVELAAAIAPMLLEERADVPPGELLDVAKRLVTALPECQPLRDTAADLYARAHAGQASRVKSLVEASGLRSGQSPRRALRTLDLCLALEPETYLASRFEGRVVRVKGYDESAGRFEIADEAGRTQAIEPKLLADECQPLDPRDFRVISRYRPAEVAPLLAEDPAGVLIGLCLSRGGRISATDIKDFLVGRFLPAEEWSDWWGRARTAAKRSPNLTLEGRAPIIVVHHPGGRTLEEELAPARESARTPVEIHLLLQQYLREAKARRLAMDSSFAGGLMTALARQAKEYLHRRPADALTAALAIQAGLRAGAPAPAEESPAVADVLSAAASPVESVAAMEDDSLWAAGLDALAARPDAPDHFRRLLALVPAGRLDDVAARLPGGADDEGLAQAVADALAEPADRLEFFLWLWQGPAQMPPGVPPRVELLTRLLRALADFKRRMDLSHATRKEFWLRARAGLSAASFASFKAAAGEMDEHVAATVKRQVERLDGLAQSAREGLLQVLRERFPALFYTKEVIHPWEEEGAIWTTEAALNRREAEYKDLTDVKMPANARAIGTAAAHGDLSENSEWKFAMEERDMLRNRAAKMHDELSRARVLHPHDVPTETVGIGSRVTLRSLSDGREVKMTFLGPWDADPERGVYAYQTRMALDLMGRAVGEEVPLKIEGQEGAWRIERIGSGLA
jgi:transcription elongation factor GreA